MMSKVVCFVDNIIEFKERMDLSKNSRANVCKKIWLADMLMEADNAFHPHSIIKIKFSLIHQIIYLLIYQLTSL